MNHSYAQDKLTMLLRDLDRYNGDEFRRQMMRITSGATGSTIPDDPHLLSQTITDLQVTNAELVARIAELTAFIQSCAASHTEDGEFEAASVYLNALKPLDATVISDFKARVIQSLRFPVMLRKMWSGGEVASWLLEQANQLQQPAAKQSD